MECTEPVIYRYKSGVRRVHHDFDRTGRRHEKEVRARSPRWKFVLHPFLGRKWRSRGCQNVVPNANYVVDSHLTRDYPLNGGLRPAANRTGGACQPGDYETRIHF